MRPRGTPPMPIAASSDSDVVDIAGTSETSRSPKRLIKILEAQAGKLFNGGCKFAVKVLAAGIPCEGLMKSVPARTVRLWQPPQRAIEPARSPRQSLSQPRLHPRSARHQQHVQVLRFRSRPRPANRKTGAHV